MLLPNPLAESSARTLNTFLGRNNCKRLLTRSPLLPMNAEELELMTQCSQAVHTLALQTQDTTTRTEASNAEASGTAPYCAEKTFKSVLRHQAARNAGVVLSWCVQQPLMVAAHVHDTASGQQPVAIVQKQWNPLNVFLDNVIGHIDGMEASRAAGILAALTQQLEQSGGQLMLPIPFLSLGCCTWLHIWLTCLEGRVQ
jgi:hypothetical protein